MEFYGKLSINPELPEKIKGLEELSSNLWWCWNQEAERLFETIDAGLWEKLEKNPVEFIAKVSYKSLKEFAEDEQFIEQYKKVMKKYHDYLEREDTWFNNNFAQLEDNKVIAYFSAEFGFHESLPIYSGGLGVLAGDHCKSASDLGLPFVGVGLLYRHGYFRQKINNEGWQQPLYPNLDFDKLAVSPVVDQNGDDLKVAVKLADRRVAIKVWQVKVGRITVYLLDTDLEENGQEDRDLTSRLYGGGQKTRISQEIVLGVGGTRALYKMGYDPAVWHMNEGHSVYLGLERVRDLMRDEGLGFDEAVEQVAGDTVFTTHTPVPAGNETFPFGLKEKYFSKYWKDVGLTRDEFMALGREDEGAEGFGLTVLALRLSRFCNGVSQLHGDVASRMWKDLWPEVPVDENPITYITNGIHTPTWLAAEWEELLSQYLPDDWKDRIEDKELWKKVKEIPAKEFWKVHKKLKAKLIDHIRQRDLKRRSRYNKAEVLDNNLLDKDALTIGFARRFATYKRATLILRDLERLTKICNEQGKEVQIIFAGKAHPADVPGQELIREIYEISQRSDFKGKLVMLEDYDMNLARYLVQGVDVWLNNPRRPLEASGTSGEKVAANGGLNFSVLDGWWCEGYNGKNGWSIGYEAEYSSRQEQDRIDADSLYETLENEIVEMYYEQDQRGISQRWVEWMKEAMMTNAPEYSTARMVQEYTERLYLPAMQRGQQLALDNYKEAKELANYKDKLRSSWNSIELSSQDQGNIGEFAIEKEIELNVQVDLGDLKTEDIAVEVYMINAIYEDESRRIIKMDLNENVKENIYSYSTKIKLYESGDYNYTFRVVPNEENLSNKHELGLIKWI